MLLISIIAACAVNFIAGLVLAIRCSTIKPNFKQFLFIIGITPVFWLVVLILYIFVGPLFWIYRRLGDEHAASS